MEMSIAQECHYCVYGVESTLFFMESTAEHWRNRKGKLSLDGKVQNRLLVLTMYIYTCTVFTFIYVYIYIYIYIVFDIYWKQKMYSNKVYVQKEE